MDDKIIVDRKVFKDLEEIFKAILADINYKGYNRNDEQVYELRAENGKNILARIDDEIYVINDLLDEKRTPSVKEKPKLEYMEKVFKLVNENLIPGVESIEVNESQKRFTVKYKYDDPPEPIQAPMFHDRLMAEPKLTKE